jgi:hypothetical protein
MEADFGKKKHLRRPFVLIFKVFKIQIYAQTKIERRAYSFKSKKP